MVFHPTTRKALIILSSLYIDSIFLFLALYFILYSKTARIIYTVSIFYGVRALCQALFLFQFPPNSVFSSPGLPSLMVPYDKTSDFYFSGHTGFLLLVSLELYHMGYWKMALGNLGMLGYMVGVLVATRAHYSIDVLIGLTFGFHAYRLGFIVKHSFDGFFKWVGEKMGLIKGKAKETTNKEKEDGYSGKEDSESEEDQNNLQSLSKDKEQ